MYLSLLEASTWWKRLRSSLDFLLNLIPDLGAVTGFLIFKPFSSKRLADYYDKGRSEKQELKNWFAGLVLIIAVILSVKWMI